MTLARYRTCKAQRSLAPRLAGDEHQRRYLAVEDWLVAALQCPCLPVSECHFSPSPSGGWRQKIAAFCGSEMTSSRRFWRSVSPPKDCQQITPSNHRFDGVICFRAHVGGPLCSCRARHRRKPHVRNDKRFNSPTDAASSSHRHPHPHPPAPHPHTAKIP